MKLTKVFVFVFAAHFCAIATLLVTPGCRTQKGTPDQTDVTPIGEGGGTVVSQSGGAISPEFNAVDFGTTTNRQAPTRPSPGFGAAPSPAPDAPAWDFQSTRVEDTAEPLLQPLQPINNGTTGGGNAGIGEGSAVMLNPELADTGTTSGTNSIHTVTKGDSLWKIARNNGVALKQLLLANSLTESSVIRPGQKIIIPSGGSITSDAPDTGTAVEDGVLYTVKSGDALSIIAQRYDTTVAAIQERNGLTSTVIRVDQTLVIPKGKKTPVSTNRTTPNPAVSSQNVYVVKRGDNPSTIASRLGVDVNELIALNGISDPTKLQEGQELIIPKAMASRGGAPATITISNGGATVRVNTPEPAPPAPPPAPDRAPTPEELRDSFNDDDENLPPLVPIVD